MEDHKLETDDVGNLILTPEQEEFSRRENKRCCDTGYWVMIRGHITWIYGTYYFELNYWYIQADTDNGYKEFRQRDRQFWMLWWQIKNEPYIIGMFNLKHRRAGATHSGYAESVVECMKRENAVSNFFNFDEKTNRRRFNEMFKPPALAAKRWAIGINNLDENSTKYECISPIKRKSIKNAAGFQAAGTKSKINILPTTVKGDDGGKINYILVDEPFKWKDIDFAEFIDAQIPTVTLGGGIKKIGHIMCISTTEEIAEGNTAYSKWVASKSYEYDENGFLRSPTKIIPVFFSAAYCLEGFVDKYGDPIMDEPDSETREWMRANPKKCPVVMGSTRYLREEKARLLAVKGPEGERAYLSFCRKHPETEDEAFMGSTGNNSFHRQILMNTLSIIRSNHGVLGVKKRIRRGNFEYIDPANKHMGCYFLEDEMNGRWHTTMLFSDPALRNRMIRGPKGLPAPQLRNRGCISVDPYSKDKVIDEKRHSLGAAHGILFFDERNERTRFSIDGNSIDGLQRNDYHPTPSLFCSYNYRPDDTTVFYEDILKCCIYYGLPCSFEENVGRIEQYFETVGMENYLLWRYEYLENPGGTDYKKRGLVMNKEWASVGYSLFDQFIKGQMPWLNGLNYSLDTEMEALRLPFEALIIQLLEFNFQRREPYDMVMSCFTGLIYMNKLFKNNTSIFQNSISSKFESPSGYQSDILGGLSGHDQRNETKLERQTRFIMEQYHSYNPQ